MGLTQLALFPLNTVLFPGGILPLQIFEIRYLDMVKRCLEDHQPFGVVALVDGGEVQRPGVDEALASVGTMAVITHQDILGPGLIKIQTVATDRFKIIQAERGQYGLWTAQVQRMDPDPLVSIPDELKITASSLLDLIARLKADGVESSYLPFSEPYQLNDCGWVANRWCELLPLALEIKQQLMSLDNPLVRLEVVGDLLIEHGVLE